MDNNLNFTPNRPLNNAEVAKFTTLTFILAAIAIAGTISGIIYHPLWFTAAGAAFMAAIVLFWRINEHDRRAFPLQRPAHQLPPDDNQAPLQSPIIRPITINGKNAVLGRLKLKNDEWLRLAAILQANQWRFVRDVVAQANVFTDITKHWKEIKLEFEQIGSSSKLLTPQHT